MGQQPSYPRYFAYGHTYHAPTPYIMAVNEDATLIVDPGGAPVPANCTVEYWERRVADKGMVEVSRDALAAAIESWNQNTGQQLKTPES